MAKLFTFIILVVGLMVLFNLAGLATSTSVILGQLGITSSTGLADVKSTAFYIAIAVTALAALIGVGTTISIGVFKTTFNETAITAVAGLVLITFLGDLISIVSYASASAGWVGYVVFLIMSPLIFGYVLALYDWVRGKD